MKKIAVIGSNMVDLVTYTDRMPVAGETLEAPDFDLGFGGKGANQAIAAAKLGGEVLMLSKVGDDVFGPNTRANFVANGIDARYVETAAGISSGVAPIFVDAKGQNSILIVKGANKHLSPVDVDRAIDDIRACDLIVMQLEISLETVYYVIELGLREHIPVLLNPAPAVAGLDMEKICQLDMLVPNETELEILTGMPVQTLEQIQAAAKFLIDAGIKKVIVTMGSKGALLVTEKEMTSVPCPQVKAKDTSGAGDAFIGCFAKHYVEGGELIPAMEEAVIYASLSTTRPGTQKSYADIDQFEAYKRFL
ncbi:ribokinase [Desulfotalea psychrophila]|nr:ribokinase [Desulfotalea psychrophila]